MTLATVPEYDSAQTTREAGHAVVAGAGMAACGTDDLAARFFERAETVVDDAWMLAVGADFQFQQTTGPKPTGTDLINRYLSRLVRTARTDGKVADAFNRVVIMEERPTSLFRPGILWRVLAPSL